MRAPVDPVALAELNQLAFRYAAAVDSCDVDAFLACFWPEARVTVFGPGADTPFTVANGHAELARIPQSMRIRFDRTAHLMTNHLVDMDADSARGTLLCTARHLFAGTDLDIVLRYVDRYERRGGIWLILDREIRFLWGTTQTPLSDEETVAIMHRARPSA